MKELIFLKKLNRKGLIELVEPSEEIKSSYFVKAENCLKSAKILSQNSLYENATSEAYYCMYNSLLALLFKMGIKSENHSASIILFDKIFNTPDLVKAILWAKEERIDKQYYVETEQNLKAVKESCNELISIAEIFLIKIKLHTNNLNNSNIVSSRNIFQSLLN